MTAASANPFGRSITIDDVRENFTFFDDWEDRYRFIIDLGKQLPGLDEADKVPDHIIHGCQSQVWITVSTTNGDLEFGLDSDAHIVRGLIAIIMSAVNARPPDAILAIDLEALFDELDLRSHLSPARGNGLTAMVQRIYALARQAQGDSPDQGLSV